MLPRLCSAAVLRLGRLTSSVRFHPRISFRVPCFRCSSHEYPSRLAFFRWLRRRERPFVWGFVGCMVLKGPPGFGRSRPRSWVPWGQRSAFRLWPFGWGKLSTCKVPWLLVLQQFNAWAQPNPAFNPDPAATINHALSCSCLPVFVPRPACGWAG
jgi:hypothetical protein